MSSHHHDALDHGSDGSLSVRRLWGVATLNVALGVAQLMGGLAFASVALLADTLHQAIDAVGLVISAVALTLAARPATRRRTFGWGRADALGALVSGLVLAASTVWIVWESVERLGSPAEVDGWGVVALGVAGALINGGSARFLGRSHELSVRAARLHLLTDMAGSLGVVLSGLVVATTGWDRIDPVISLLISATVIFATVRLLVRAANMLLDATPTGIDVAEVEAAMRSVADVTDVHHLHVWSLSPNDVAVTAHVEMEGEDATVHAAQATAQEIEALLAERFGITHTTVQVECHACEAPDH